MDSRPVYVIKDLNGNENVWGPGIIMARRAMDLAEKMNILASARFANDLKMLKGGIQEHNASNRRLPDKTRGEDPNLQHLH